MSISKLNRPAEFVPYLSLVRRKEDGDSPKQEQRQQKDDGKKDQTFEEALEVSEERVDEAIAQFQKDSQAQGNGLIANKEGNGPGMKIVLKDGAGGVIRQFTGEEFMRLRQAASGGRGRLLDKKL